MDLAALLSDARVTFASGVPDSVLAPFLDQLAATRSIRHLVAGSEGSAVALAAGAVLARGERACVYMQNSGLPNALNPLMSLFAPGLYDIGLTLVIGWRGEPGTPDEPQHAVIGTQTQALLATLGLVPLVLRADMPVSAVIDHLRAPHAAILVPRGVLTAMPTADRASGGLSRTEVLRTLLQGLPPGTTVFGGVGHVSREMMALRAAGTLPVLAEFPVVGGMGYAAHLALGAALADPAQPVWCLDGDGAFLMHGTGLACVAVQDCRLRHVVLNNRCHNSVGGFATCAPDLDLSRVASALGYPLALRVTEAAAVTSALAQIAAHPGPAFLEVLCDTHLPASLPRPVKPLAALKDDFLAARSAPPDGG